MWSAYIIQILKDGKFYIGCTGDIEKRLFKHNAGGNISTRHRRPFKLVYSEEFTTKAEALKRERQIKSYKGGDAFRKLIHSWAGTQAVNGPR
jgi:putative endonuclease